MQEIHYRVRRTAVGHFPGSHASRRGEHGLEYRGHLPLMAVPDARRIDLQRSLRDPWEQFHVRVYDEPKAVPVVVVADLSGSMGFAGTSLRLDVLADFTAALAWSAWRCGDPFGFVGCDDAVREPWLLPLARAKGAGLALAQRLRAHQPQGSAAGLLDAHRWLRRQRSLVFVVSDFHLPLAQVDRLFATLAQHEVVPVVLADRSERLPPGRGLVWLADAETGRRRPVWLRESMRRRWLEAATARDAQFDACCLAHRLAPLRLTGGFDAAAVTAHFHDA